MERNLLHKVKKLMKKLLVGGGLIVAFAFALSVTPVFAAGALQVKSCALVPYPLSPLSGCNFQFFDGNGSLRLYEPDSYHDVLTPSGVETEVFKGTVPNDTGHAVIYSSNSGSPIDEGQTCYSFVTERKTTDWQETISASGNFTLTCHFH